MPSSSATAGISPRACRSMQKRTTRGRALGRVLGDVREDAAAGDGRPRRNRARRGARARGGRAEQLAAAEERARTLGERGVAGAATRGGERRARADRGAPSARPRTSRRRGDARGDRDARRVPGATRRRPRRRRGGHAAGVRVPARGRGRGLAASPSMRRTRTPGTREAICRRGGLAASETRFARGELRARDFEPGPDEFPRPGFPARARGRLLLLLGPEARLHEFARARLRRCASSRHSLAPRCPSTRRRRGAPRGLRGGAHGTIQPPGGHGQDALARVVARLSDLPVSGSAEKRGCPGSGAGAWTRLRAP